MVTVVSIMDATDFNEKDKQKSASAETNQSSVPANFTNSDALSLTSDHYNIDVETILAKQAYSVSNVFIREKRFLKCLKFRLQNFHNVINKSN